jgi:hypothetical protein
MYKKPKYAAAPAAISKPRINIGQVDCGKRIGISRTVPNMKTEAMAGARKGLQKSRGLNPIRRRRKTRLGILVTMPFRMRPTTREVTPN